MDLNAEERKKRKEKRKKEKNEKDLHVEETYTLCFEVLRNTFPALGYCTFLLAIEASFAINFFVVAGWHDTNFSN